MSLKKNWARCMSRLALLFLAFALCACASLDDYLTKATNEQDTRIAERGNIASVLPTEGAIAFTIFFDAPSAGKGSGSLQGSNQGTNFYTLKGKKTSDGMFGLAYMNTFEANKRHTVFFKLEPNQYHFHKIFFHGGELILPKPIPFSVKQGEMSYLGHLVVTLPEKNYGNYRFGIHDESLNFLTENQTAIQKTPLKFVNQSTQQR